MMLSCRLCGHQISTTQAGATGRTVVIDQLMHHLTHQHKQNTRELAATIAAASGYFAVRMFGTVPDGENDLRAGLADTERELFGLLAGDAIAHLREFLPGQGGARGGN